MIHPTRHSQNFSQKLGKGRPVNSAKFQRDPLCASRLATAGTQLQAAGGETDIEALLDTYPLDLEGKITYSCFHHNVVVAPLTKIVIAFI